MITVFRGRVIGVNLFGFIEGLIFGPILISLFLLIKIYINRMAFARTINMPE